MRRKLKITEDMSIAEAAKRYMLNEGVSMMVYGDKHIKKLCKVHGRKFTKKNKRQTDRMTLRALKQSDDFFEIRTPTSKSDRPRQAYILSKYVKDDRAII